MTPTQKIIVDFEASRQRFMEGVSEILTSDDAYSASLARTCNRLFTSGAMAVLSALSLTRPKDTEEFLLALKALLDFLMLDDKETKLRQAPPAAGGRPM